MSWQGLPERAPQKPPWTRWGLQQRGPTVAAGHKQLIGLASLTRLTGSKTTKEPACPARTPGLCSVGLLQSEGPTDSWPSLRSFHPRSIKSSFVTIKKMTYIWKKANFRASATVQVAQSISRLSLHLRCWHPT